MSAYTAPLKDMRFVLNELAGLAAVAALPGFQDATPDTADAILDEASKFASEVLDPLNYSGDQEGSKWKDGVVTTPKGFKEAYKLFCEGGWSALSLDPEWGGQGLPKLLSTPVTEMITSANMSFSLCPMLTQGAIEAMLLSGTEQLKKTFLPKMFDGSWTGTMNLTESQAGSDLALVRTKAVREGGHLGGRDQQGQRRPPGEGRYHAPASHAEIHRRAGERWPRTAPRPPVPRDGGWRTPVRARQAMTGQAAAARRRRAPRPQERRTDRKRPSRRYSRVGERSLDSE